MAAIGGEVALDCVLEVDTGRRQPARARRARPSARSVGRVRRSARSQRSPARAAPRARDRPGPRERAGLEHVARGHRRSRRPESGRRVRRFAARVPPAAPPLGVAGHPRARRPRVVLVVLRADRPAHERQRAASRAFGCSAAGSTLELAVVASCSCSPSRSCTTRSVASRGGDPQPRGNDDARGEAVTLAAAGGVGLITAHTRRPELTDLGGGSFYANCGSGGRVVECVPRARRASRRCSSSGCGARGSSSRRARSCTPGSGTACATSRTPRWMERIAVARTGAAGVAAGGRRASIRAPSPGRRPATRPPCAAARAASRRPRSRSRA